ncbi:MAG: hypothetical protein ABJG15_19450 [Hyphomonadaceae bacterium]
MSKPKRIIMAIITGLVTLLLANQIAFAEPTDRPDVFEDDTCTAITRKTYEDALQRRDIEQSPAYRLAVAEDFLAICDTPLHVQAVAKEAGRAALDSGATTKALGHYELAIANGASLSESEHLDYMLSLWLDGESERAWTLRDELLDYWLARAARYATVTSTSVRDGIIHKIEFDDPVGNVKTRTHWIAQPHGEGWPAAVSLDADPALIAFATFRLGQRAQSMQDLTLIQCRGRSTALRAYGPIGETLANDTAVEVLKTYLGAPQIPNHKDAKKSAAACFATDRLFVPLH